MIFLRGHFNKVSIFWLIFFIIMIGGCTEKVKTTPINNITFNLEPQVSEEILSAINWNDSDSRLVSVGLTPVRGGFNLWSISASTIDSDKLNAIMVAELNSSALLKARQQFLSLLNSTDYAMVNASDDIYYHEHNIFKFCDKYLLTIYADSDSFEKLIDALKKYDCLSDSNVRSLLIEIPEYSVINEEVRQYLADKGYSISAIHFNDKIGDEYLSFDFSYNNPDFMGVISITQKKEDFINYTKSRYLGGSLPTLTKNETFKNGNYLLFNHSMLIKEDKILISQSHWYCTDIGYTIDITNKRLSPPEPLSFEEIKEISRFLC